MILHLNLTTWKPFITPKQTQDTVLQHQIKVLHWNTLTVIRVIPMFRTTIAYFILNKYMKFKKEYIPQQHRLQNCFKLSSNLLVPITPLKITLVKLKLQGKVNKIALNKI